MKEDGHNLALQIEHLLEIGRPLEAGRLLGGLLARDPEDPEVLFLAARVEKEKGGATEARLHLGRVLARSPEHMGARLLLFELDLEGGRFSEAETLVLGLLRQRPEDGELLALYARLCLRGYQLDKARALVDEALRRAPASALAQTLDALLHIIRGDDAGASARLAKLMAEDPEAIHVAWTALAVLQAQHRPREVLEIGRQLLRLTPNDDDLVGALVEARVQSHWSLKPLWPFQRFGWGGSMAVWMAFAIGVVTVRKASPGITAPFVAAYLLYVAYIWITRPPPTVAIR